jgi:tetratricopeptide (TPR) repeat protein
MNARDLAAAGSPRTRPCRGVLRGGLAVLLLVPGLAASARAQEPPKTKGDEGLFLDMSHLKLGTITSDEDKRKYIYTIQLEKARIERQDLQIVYENAFDLYKDGKFEDANELTSKILAIDPGFEEASVLNRATQDLQGSVAPRAFKREMLADRFEEGMSLYRQGRLAEASEKWKEVVELSPSNLKARYWLRKANDAMAVEHYRRGQQAYRQHRLSETLDQWYAALVLNPRFPHLTQAIAKVESEERQEKANEQLQTALNLYSQGLVLESLKMLDQVLETGPGNVKAQKLQTEIRAEVANQHVAEGRRLYESRQYDKAIGEWKAATQYGYDSSAAGQLIARAEEQKRREADAKKQAEEQAQERAEAAKKEKAKNAALEAEEKRKAAEQAVVQSSAPAAAPAAPAAPALTSADAKKQSEQAYLEGVIAFQRGDYQTARNKWLRAKQLDPNNSDAVAGIDKIDQLYGSGQ